MATCRVGDKDKVDVSDKKKGKVESTEEEGLESSGF